MPFLIHVSIPPKKEELIQKFIKDAEIRSVNRLQGASSIVFLFRVSDSRLIDVLKQLDVVGVGIDFGIVNILRIEATKPEIKEEKENSDAMSTFGTRLPTEVIYSEITAMTTITFDYIMFLIVASVLAGIGLSTNSSVITVASMLVSPLMAPIVGLTFGAAVRDKKLVKKGLIAEALGVFICFLSGFVIALCLSKVGRELTLPTKEMTDRGQMLNIYFGIAIAFFSGIGVALSIAGGAVSSLVGVAISASILPPVVNCGLLFGLATCGPSIVGDETVYNRPLLLQYAGVSFLLWFVNFACIFLAGVLVFKVKQIAAIPMRGSIFWAELDEVMHKEPDARPWNRHNTLRAIQHEVDGSLRVKNNKNYADPAWRQSLAKRLANMEQLDPTSQRLRDYTTSVL